jgi:hypothetical protein
MDRKQMSQSQKGDEMEWVLVSEPPRKVPVPVVASARLQHPDAGAAQAGVLIAVHWLVDGQVVAREIEFPVEWPRPIPVEDPPLRIDFGTPIAPYMLETRVFRALDENGLPQPPASAIWCRYLDAMATCRITREDEHDNWQIALDLPAGIEEFFVSMHGESGILSDSPLAETSEWSAFDAGWIFAVNVD